MHRLSNSNAHLKIGASAGHQRRLLRPAQLVWAVVTLMALAIVAFIIGAPLLQSSHPAFAASIYQGFSFVWPSNTRAFISSCWISIRRMFPLHGTLCRI